MSAKFHHSTMMGRLYRLMGRCYRLDEVKLKKCGKHWYFFNKNFYIFKII